MTTLTALLTEGPDRVGQLAERGTFDQYATYQPGNIVVDDGVVYLNIAPVGAAPVLEDTFQRQDQNGWGQSSHGEAWQTSAAYAQGFDAVIRAGRGHLQATSGDAPSGQLLGPAVLRSNVEALLGLDVGVPGSGDTNQLSVGLNTTEDGTSLATVELSVSDAGVTHLQVTAAVAPGSLDSGTSEVGPSLTDLQSCWLRLRAVGLAYSATLWPAGTAEPATPQATFTASDPQPAGHPLILVRNWGAGVVASIRYFALRHLTAATAPADDTEHWVALADALQVPQPY